MSSLWSCGRLGERVFDVAVTISSPYDTPERYADGWRVLDRDGQRAGDAHADARPRQRTALHADPARAPYPRGHQRGHGRGPRPGQRLRRRDASRWRFPSEAHYCVGESRAFHHHALLAGAGCRPRDGEIARPTSAWRSPPGSCPRPTGRPSGRRVSETVAARPALFPAPTAPRLDVLRVSASGSGRAGPAGGATAACLEPGAGVVGALRPRLPRGRRGPDAGGGADHAGHRLERHHRVVSRRGSSAHDAGLRRSAGHPQWHLLDRRRAVGR